MVSQTAPLASYPVLRARAQPFERALLENTPEYVWRMAELTESQLLRLAVEDVSTEIGDGLQAQTQQFVAALDASAQEVSSRLDGISDLLVAGFGSLVRSVQELTDVVEAGVARLAELDQAQLEVLERIEDVLLAPIEVRSRERRQRGLKAYERGMLTEAKADLSAAVGENVYDHVAWLHLGHIGLRSREHEEALEAYEHAVRYALTPPKGDPDRAETIGLFGLVGTARALQHLGRHDEAAVAARRAVEMDDSRADSWYELGRSSLLGGHDVVAVEALHAALLRDPTLIGTVSMLEPSQQARDATRAATLEFAQRREELRLLAVSLSSIAAEHGAPFRQPEPPPATGFAEMAKANQRFEALLVRSFDELQSWARRKEESARSALGEVASDRALRVALAEEDRRVEAAREAAEKAAEHTRSKRDERITYGTVFVIGTAIAAIIARNMGMTDASNWTGPLVADLLGLLLLLVFSYFVGLLAGEALAQFVITPLVARFAPSRPAEVSSRARAIINEHNRRQAAHREKAQPAFDDATKLRKALRDFERTMRKRIQSRR